MKDSDSCIATDFYCTMILLLISIVALMGCSSSLVQECEQNTVEYIWDKGQNSTLGIEAPADVFKWKVEIEYDSAQQDQIHKRVIFRFGGFRTYLDWEEFDIQLVVETFKTFPNYISFKNLNCTIATLILFKTFMFLTQLFYDDS